MITSVRGNGQGIDKGDITYIITRNNRRGSAVGKVYGILSFRRVSDRKGEPVWRLTLRVTTDPTDRGLDANEQIYHVYDSDFQRGLNLIESFFRLNYALTGNRSPVELCQIQVQMLGSCNWIVSRVPRERASTRVQFIRKHDIGIE